MRWLRKICLIELKRYILVIVSVTCMPRSRRESSYQDCKYVSAEESIEKVFAFEELLLYEVERLGVQRFPEPHV